MFVTAISAEEVSGRRSTIKPPPPLPLLDRFVSENNIRARFHASLVAQEAVLQAYFAGRLTDTWIDSTAAALIHVVSDPGDMYTEVRFDALVKQFKEIAASRGRTIAATYVWDPQKCRRPKTDRKGVTRFTITVLT